MRRLLVLLVLLASGVLLAASAAQASATVTRTSISGPMFDSCTGEIVNVDLTLTTVTSFFTDTTGGFHLLVHMTESGSAVGATTGNVYQVQSVQTETDQAFSDGVAESFTLTSTFHLIGQGTATDLQAHTTNHLAIVNGEVIAFVSNISFDCA